MIETKQFFSRQEYQSIMRYGLNVEHSVVLYDFVPHSHNFNETFIILNGTAQHILGDREYLIGRGDVFAIKGDTAHGFRDVNSLEIINLMYDPHIFLQSAPELYAIPGFEPLFVIEPEVRLHSNYPSILKLDDKALSYVQMMADFIVEQQQRLSDALAPVIRMNFNALIAYLATQYDARSEEAERMRILAKACSYMKLNLDKPIRLSDIAAQAYISTRQLERLFAELYGDTPMGYLQKIRLQNALTLLIKHADPVKRAASLSGFTDPAYFARVFRTTYGITPNMAKKLITGLSSQIHPYVDKPGKSDSSDTLPIRLLDRE